MTSKDVFQMGISVLKMLFQRQLLKRFVTYCGIKLGVVLLTKQPGLNQVSAIGAAGTVYLCHPFLVHSAQKHRGTVPKFMAQPPLLLVGSFEIENNHFSHNPVEQAIRRAIGLKSHK